MIPFANTINGYETQVGFDPCADLVTDEGCAISLRSRFFTKTFRQTVRNTIYELAEEINEA